VRHLWRARTDHRAVAATDREAERAVQFDDAGRLSAARRYDEHGRNDRNHRRVDGALATAVRTGRRSIVRLDESDSEQQRIDRLAWHELYLRNHRWNRWDNGQRHAGRAPERRVDLRARRPLV